ncbi:hypothetical protein K443DRAFT_674587, partial [Laccaria amethystina LaAM-08-1]
MPLLLERQDLEVVLWPEDRGCDRKWLLENAVGATALIVMVGADKIDTDVLDAAGPSLRVVSTMSVGYEHIDITAAAKRGIKVGYTPDVLTDAVADLTVMLALMAGRNVRQTMKIVNDGQWPTCPWSPFLFCGPQFSASPSRPVRTAGFLGFGRIAQATLARLIPFGFTDCIYSSNPSSTPNTSRDLELKAKLGLASLAPVTLDELAARSDVVFVLAPGGSGTRHLVNEAFLRKMKRTSVLVNTSRGSLVDSDALAKVLSEGLIWGAGLDVVEGEPQVTADHPLVKEPRCAILPHIGSATLETRVEMARLAAENALSAIDGKPMPASLNLPSL